MSVDLERELGARLHQRSSEAPVGDGWEAIHRRIDARHRARQRRRATACALGVVVAVVAGVVVLRGGTPKSRVATRPPAVEQARPALPRLVLDVPGWQIESAGAEEAGGGPTTEPALWLLREPGREFDGKVVFLTIADPSKPYGIGDLSPGAAVVDVRGHRAYLNRSPFSGQLGWRLDDGTAVHLTSARLSGDELIDVGRALEIAPDRTLVLPSGSLPGGLALGRFTAPGDWDARLTAHVSYTRPSARLALQLESGGEWMFDTLVRDRLVSAETAQTVTVGGARAVLTSYQEHGSGVAEAGTATYGSHSVLWTVRPGVVAEVRADGVTAQEALAAAASVKEIADHEWELLVERFRPGPASPPPGDGTGPGRHAEVRDAMCMWRDTWLGGKREVVSHVRDLRATAKAEHLDRDSDLVVVLDQLVAAMEAGDADAVRSIPAGGC